MKRTGVLVGKWKANVDVVKVFSFHSVNTPFSMPDRSRTLTQYVGCVFLACNAKETLAAKNIGTLS